VIIAATLPDPHADTARLAAAVAATPGVSAVTPVVVSRDGQAAMLIAYPTTGEQDPATDTLVNRIHDTVLPKATAGTGISAYVTGPNAGNVSFANLIGQRLPWLIGVVVALSMLLLLVVFRSVVIAVKAAVMNLLSITAAYGALVMVSQNGWLGSLFGFPEKVPVTTWVPMFLFVILFGLSMDYEVRLVLVPAVMELLGRANWWLPGWLDRLLPKTSLSEDEPPAEAPAGWPVQKFR
jgi:RND superfamily putative drug exporter